MKLPISVLVLAAVSQAVSNLESESFTTAPNVKRDLHEGIFGQKTRLVNKYASEAPPRIQYVDESKEILEPPPQHHPIFGARLVPVSKISDLLTGQGPPFEVALTSHLYSPVSVYNTKQLASNPFEVPVPAASKNIFTGPNFFKQRKMPISAQLPSEENQPSPDLPPQNTLPNTELYNLPEKFPASSFLNPSQDTEFDPNYIQGSFQRTNTFTEPETSQLFPVPADKYNFPFPNPIQNSPLQFYQPQQYQYVPVDPSFEYIKQGNNQEEKLISNNNQDLPQETQTKRPELPEKLSIPKQAYHAHPNGAISYASFTHNQGALGYLHETKLQYKQPQQIQQEPSEQQSRHQQIFEPRGPKEYQHFVNVPRIHYSESPLKLKPNEKTPIVKLVPVSQTQQNQAYLNPIRQKLLHELQQGPLLQSLEYHPQQNVVKILPTAESKLLGQHLTLSPRPAYTTPHYKRLSELKQFAYPEEPTARPSQEDADDSSDIHIQRYTPQPPSVTYRQYTDHTSSATTSEPPTTTEKPDQITQSTTVEPETTFSEKYEQTEARTLNLRSSTAVSPLSVLPLHSTPASLQSLTTYPSSTFSPEILSPAQQTHTSRHSVQIQQQELQEIHSELAPEIRPQQPTNKSQEDEHQILAVTPRKYQSTSSPTSPNPDYEIEISSNIDYNQLPKDLRPVPTAQAESQHAEQRQSQTEHTVQESSTKQDQNEPQEQKQENNEQQEQALNQEPEYDQKQLQELLVLPQNLNKQNLPSFDSSYLTRVQPIFHPELFSSNQKYVIQPEIFQPQIPTFPPVQYFGKYAETIFRGFDP